MFRSHYDNDTSTWSPQGRLLQVEYAMEAVKQGSIALGCRNKDHVVLVALKRSPDDLTGYQKKIFKIDSHVGVAISGLASDARILGSFMRKMSLEQRQTLGRNIPCRQLAISVADKAQVNTQMYGGRPYGVGLLVGGVDDNGAHLFECLPSGACEEYFGMAIGARSQAARTYMENHLSEFLHGSLENLVLHGLRALRDSLGPESKLAIESISVSIVGKDSAFCLLETDELAKYLETLNHNGMDIE